MENEVFLTLNKIKQWRSKFYYINANEGCFRCLCGCRTEFNHIDDIVNSIFETVTSGWKIIDNYTVCPLCQNGAQLTDIDHIKHLIKIGSIKCSSPKVNLIQIMNELQLMRERVRHGGHTRKCQYYSVKYGHSCSCNRLQILNLIHNSDNNDQSTT